MQIIAKNTIMHSYHHLYILAKQGTMKRDPHKLPDNESTEASLWFPEGRNKRATMAVVLDATTVASSQVTQRCHQVNVTFNCP